jgi:hypothetical protein
MQKSALSRLTQFEKEFKDIDLANYYKMNERPLEELHVHAQLKENTILLNIHYEKLAPLIEVELPPELIHLIGEFLSYTIEIQTKIKYSTNYPFVPPVWFMENIHHTLKPRDYEPSCIVDYYVDKLNQHNQQYNRRSINEQWSPAISVEKDILVFLQRVHHFHEMNV